MYAEKILAPTYATLEARAIESLRAVDPTFVGLVTARNSVSEEKFEWKMVSALPSVAEHKEKLVGAVKSGSSGDSSVGGVKSLMGDGMKVHPSEVPGQVSL